ncbi:MAG: O-antigen ligase family protein [bacterium]
MRSHSLAAARGGVFAAAAIVLLSVALGLLVGQGRRELVAVVGGSLLFVALVWDMRLVAPVMAVALPLAPRFETGFGNVYLSTAILALAFVAWLWRAPLTRSPLSFPTNRVLTAMAIMVSVMVLSAAQDLPRMISDAPALLKFVQLCLYLGMFVMLTEMSWDSRATRAVLALVIAVGLVEALIGAWQNLSRPGFYTRGTLEGGHNDYAIYMVFVALLLLGVLLESRRPAVAVGCLAGLAVLAYSIVFSFSRGSYVGLLAALVTFGFMPFSRKRKIILLAVAVGFIGFLFALAPTDVVYRARSILSTLTGKVVTLSFNLRLGMWRAALADFMDNPILGRGTWSYSLRDNFYIKMLGEAGALGLAAFLGLIYAILREEWRAINLRASDTLTRGVTLGLMPATVGCLVVGNMSGDFFLSHRFMGTFWIVLALALVRGLGRERTGLDRAGQRT